VKVSVSVTTASALCTTVCSPPILIVDDTTVPNKVARRNVSILLEVNFVVTIALEVSVL
jgi:hypothetical protein